MKKVTINLYGGITEENAGKVSEALNNLSGVVAADVFPGEGKAYAYAGDRLSRQAIDGAIALSGCQGTIIQEEYLSGVRDMNVTKNYFY